MHPCAADEPAAAALEAEAELLLLLPPMLPMTLELPPRLTIVTLLAPLKLKYWRSSVCFPGLATVAAVAAVRAAAAAACSSWCTAAASSATAAKTSPNSPSESDIVALAALSC